MIDLQETIENARRDDLRRKIVVALLAFATAGIGVLGYGAYATMYTTEKPVAVQEELPDTYRDIVLSAKAAIVYDLATEEVLYEKNADAQLPLASLTKLITIYAAAGTLPDTAPVTFTRNALDQYGDEGFHEGDTFSFADIARMTLVASSNDAAEAIREAASEYAKANEGMLLANAISALGLTETYALNGTGLDENGSISGGYGSARDMAIVAGALLERAPAIARATIDPTSSATTRAGVSYTLKNTNPDVQATPGLMLSKTGFTDLAGGNLVEVYDAGLGHPVAIVVLGSTREERFTDVSRLMRATIARFSGVSLPAL